MDGVRAVEGLARRAERVLRAARATWITRMLLSPEVRPSVPTPREEERLPTLVGDSRQVGGIDTSDTSSIHESMTSHCSSNNLCAINDSSRDVRLESGRNGVRLGEEGRVAVDELGSHGVVQVRLQTSSVTVPPREYNRTDHILSSSDEDESTRDLRKDSHVDSGVRDDLSLDPKSRLSALQLGVGKLSTNVQVTCRDGNSCRVHPSALENARARRERNAPLASCHPRFPII